MRISALLLLFVLGVMLGIANPSHSLNVQTGQNDKGLEVHVRFLRTKSDYKDCQYEFRLTNSGKETIMVSELATPGWGLFWKLVDSKGIRVDLTSGEIVEPPIMQANAFVPLPPGKTIIRGPYRWADYFMDVKEKMDLKARLVYSIKGGAILPEKPEFPVWMEKTPSREIKLSLSPGKVTVK